MAGLLGFSTIGQASITDYDPVTMDPPVPDED